MENVLSAWREEKDKYLLKLFNNELILSRPYTYETPVEGIAQDIEERIEEEGYNSIYYRFRERISEILSLRDYAVQFLKFWHYSLFDTEALASNTYQGESKQITFPDGITWKIPRGMKLMKVFGKIVDRNGDKETKELFEEFKRWHSLTLNQMRLDGVLCLSIHPLDYLTMSDNDGSWTSCMHWMDEGSDECHAGDYRAGTVECMNSPYVIVAYLHNPKRSFDFWHNWRTDEKMAWNKKKWRELFIVQNGIITEVKGYPYQDENLTNTVLMWIKELAEKNLGWKYDDIEINIADAYLSEDNIENRFSVSTSAYMYDDIGTLDLHRARINLRDLHKRASNKEIQLIDYLTRDGQEVNLFTINYGGKMTCMCCGDDIQFIEDRSTNVFCLGCEAQLVCPLCGDYYEPEQGIEVSAFDKPICYHCYDTDCYLDDLSEDYEYMDSLVEIRVCLGRDYNRQLVFYSQTFNTLNPDDYFNENYMNMFNAKPLEENGTLYITKEMCFRDGDFYDMIDVDGEEEYLAMLVERGVVVAF